MEIAPRNRPAMSARQLLHQLQQIVDTVGDVEVSVNVYTNDVAPDHAYRGAFGLDVIEAACVQFPFDPDLPAFVELFTRLR